VKILKIITLVGVLLLSYYFVAYHSNSSNDNHVMTNDNPLTAPQKTTYICPMHSHITSDLPAQTCPICGMDLVPMEDDSMADAISTEERPVGRSDINLPEKRRQMIGLKLARVEKKQLFRTVKAPARAAFDPELYTAQAEYQQALLQYQRVKNSSLDSVKRNVDRMLESARVRLEVLGLSKNQIDLIKANSNLSESLLVNKKGANLWVYADVFEMDLRNIEKGQSVKLTANYLEGAVIAGVVSSTDQVINANTRTAKVRIQVQKSPVKIRPESYLDASIFVPQGEHVAVPFDAIVDTGEEAFVYRSLGAGQFTPQLIQIAFRSGDYVAVADGLSEGDDIVVSGNFLVDSESQLKAVLNEAKRASSSEN